MQLTAVNTRSIVIPVLILACIGTIMIYSSTALMSMRNNDSGFNYLWKHLFTVGIGIVAMLIMSRTDYRKLMPKAYILLGFSLVLLVLVFMPGIGISANGAQRWLRLWPATFQPSELVKLVMVIALARYMDNNIQNMKNLRYGIAIPLGAMLVFQVIIILQPDFGAVMSIGILTISLLILGGAHLKHIGAMLLCSLPVVYMLILSSSYRMKRFSCFIDPWKEPFGCGFQLVQSFIAFGNGNIFGLGIGDGRQKLYFLPEAHTDFIFSLIGEELGIGGVLLVLGTFVWLFIKGISLAARTNDPFSYFLTMGLSMMIGIQAIINFAVTTGLMPTKGLPLPFISYGGSALVINMAAVGILMNIASRHENPPPSTRVPTGRSRRDLRIKRRK